MNQKNRGLFPISQAAKACGISRSTLMRMEDKGLLVPAYTAPSGRRYYDNHNISLILQIQLFQSMGFDTKEIAHYFAKGGDAAELLATLEERLALMQRNIEELRMRSMEVPHMSIQLIKLPETVCCVRKYDGRTYQDKYDAMYAFYHECIENGCVLAPEPLFLINEYTGFLEGQLPKHPHPFQVCVPVLPEHAPDNAVRFPSCTALSILFYGYDFSEWGKAWLRLGREVKERGLTPDGYLRGIGIVAPYTGREINPKRYCSRCAVPVKM